MPPVCPLPVPLLKFGLPAELLKSCGPSGCSTFSNHVLCSKTTRPFLHWQERALRARAAARPSPQACHLATSSRSLCARPARTGSVAGWRPAVRLPKPCPARLEGKGPLLERLRQPLYPPLPQLPRALNRRLNSCSPCSWLVLLALGAAAWWGASLAAAVELLAGCRGGGVLLAETTAGGVSCARVRPVARPRIAS